MNKAELIERIIDTFTCMGSEDPEDTAYANEITIDEAEVYLNELRANERDNLEPDEWLPAEVTPALYMEAFNCYLHKCRYDVTVLRLSGFISLHENVDICDLCRDTYNYLSPTDTLIYPTDWLTENMEFPFTSEDLSMLELITLGQNSPDFKADSEYCWYDSKNKQLHSTDTPYADGLIDADALTEFILSDKDLQQEVIDTYMVNTDIDYIFRFWEV